MISLGVRLACKIFCGSLAFICATHMQHPEICRSMHQHGANYIVDMLCDMHIGSGMQIATAQRVLLYVRASSFDKTLSLETLLQHRMRRQLALYFSMVRRKLC